MFVLKFYSALGSGVLWKQIKLTLIAHGSINEPFSSVYYLTNTFTKSLNGRCNTFITTLISFEAYETIEQCIWNDNNL